jgi:hypothetical protein
MLKRTDMSTTKVISAVMGWNEPHFIKSSHEIEGDVIQKEEGQWAVMVKPGPTTIFRLNLVQAIL